MTSSHLEPADDLGLTWVRPGAGGKAGGADLPRCLSLRLLMLSAEGGDTECCPPNSPLRDRGAGEALLVLVRMPEDGLVKDVSGVVGMLASGVDAILSSLSS